MKTLWLILVAAALLSMIGQFVIEVWQLLRGGNKSGDLPPAVWHNRFDRIEAKMDKVTVGQANMTVDMREVMQSVQDVEQKMPPA